MFLLDNPIARPLKIHCQYGFDMHVTVHDHESTVSVFCYILLSFEGSDRLRDCASMCSTVQSWQWKATHMKSLSFTEFRKRASEILTLVEKGETVRVVRHGKTVAQIIPAETEEKTPSWKRPGLRLVRPGASLSKAILEERRKSR